MTRTRSLLSSLTAGAALAVLTACGSASTTSSPAPDATLPAPTSSPTATVAETTVPPATVPETPEPETPEPEPAPVDDLVTPTVPPTTAPTPPPTIPPVIAPAGPANPCGVVDDIPVGAVVESDRIVDVTGDGTADDRIVSYFDGGWTLRAEVGGAISELSIADVGPGAVRALGTADVAGLTSGNEIIATTGSGAYTQRIGIFGIDASGCLFRFVDGGGNDLEFLSGASIAFGDRFACETHAVSAASWSLYDVDNTYDLGAAAYHESSPGVFTYLPASDDYLEGVAPADLPDVFDCFGLTL